MLKASVLMFGTIIGCAYNDHKSIAMGTSSCQSDQSDENRCTESGLAKLRAKERVVLLQKPTKAGITQVKSKQRMPFLQRKSLPPVKKPGENLKVAQVKT